MLSSKFQTGRRPEDWVRWRRRERGEGPRGRVVSWLPDAVPPPLLLLLPLVCAGAAPFAKEREGLRDCRGATVFGRGRAFPRGHVAVAEAEDKSPEFRPSLVPWPEAAPRPPLEGGRVGRPPTVGWISKLKGRTAGTMRARPCRTVRRVRSARAGSGSGLAWPERAGCAGRGAGRAERGETLEEGHEGDGVEKGEEVVWAAVKDSGGSPEGRGGVLPLEDESVDDETLEGLAPPTTAGSVASSEELDGGDRGRHLRASSSPPSALPALACVGRAGVVTAEAAVVVLAPGAVADRRSIGAGGVSSVA
mmetsp:Transcript_7832/g.22252  ORF Transcript_7832/g.22252 Transcript_7832/m.22252 type:complete len:306 (-) Transcript_7832:1229-2146(-)